MIMLSKHGLAVVSALSATFLFAGSASTHQPFCICKRIDATTIRCEGGFSDGTGVPGVKLDIVRYDESIVVETKFGTDSTISFR